MLFVLDALFEILTGSKCYFGQFTFHICIGCENARFNPPALSKLWFVEKVVYEILSMDALFNIIDTNFEGDMQHQFLRFSWHLIINI